MGGPTNPGEERGMWVEGGRPQNGDGDECGRGRRRRWLGFRRGGTHCCSLLRPRLCFSSSWTTTRHFAFTGVVWPASHRVQGNEMLRACLHESMD
uniref:Uncharacterized protein n=1 Tax=Oryza punctata TaxID=4537 RepID=A0A0E0LXC5_ORYPU